MVRSADEIDFEQYYEDWRHRDEMTWEILPVTVALGGAIIIGSYFAEIPWHVRALTFGLGAFCIATLTVMLAQNLYYQWRDEKHLEHYGKQEKLTPQSKPIPPKTGEEEKEIGTKPRLKLMCDRLKRIMGPRRMGSTLLLVTCFLFYLGLSYLFGSTWQWCYRWPCYLILGIATLVIAFVFPFGWFLIWLAWGIDKE